MSQSRQRALLHILLVLYWAVSLDYLTSFPVVGQDEPWIAAAPAKLATTGIYGSDLFTGHYGMEHRNYQHPPLYSMAQAIIFRYAGIGVFQMRFLPVACGLLVLALTFAVGRQIGADGTALLSTVLLMGLSVTARGEESGILLMDLARINRYDIAVPLFGLAAYWAFHHGETSGGAAGWYLGSGLCVGLASLCHLYGLFWLPALVALLLIRRDSGSGSLLRSSCLMAVGALLPYIPWALYIVDGWDDYRGQMLFVAERFDISNPRFYVENLLSERDRWPLNLWDDQTGQFAWWRLGASSTIITLPTALAFMAREVQKGKRPAAAGLVVVLLVQSCMFALLLKVKDDNYGIALWPLTVLFLAWFFARVWRTTSGTIRFALALMLAAILAEGVLKLANRRVEAAETTPYEQWMAPIAAGVPPGALVLGLPHYALALPDASFRSWLLPVLRVDERFSDEPVEGRVALEDIAPTAIILDEPMRQYFEELTAPAHPQHSLLAGFEGYLSDHGNARRAHYDDPYYGAVELILIDRSPGTLSSP